jgi:hypothetical protein
MGRRNIVLRRSPHHTHKNVLNHFQATAKNISEDRNGSRHVADLTSILEHSNNVCGVSFMVDISINETASKKWCTANYHSFVQFFRGKKPACGGGFVILLSVVAFSPKTGVNEYPNILSSTR